MAALAALCALLSWLPGYGLLANLRRLSAAERVACAGCLSAAICGFVALWCFLLGAPTWPALVAPLILGGLGLAAAYRRGGGALWAPSGSFALDDAARQVARLWLLFLAELVVLEALLPTFGGADWTADWWVHFHRALVYANLVPVGAVARTCIDAHLHCTAPVFDHGVMTARTPLYNLLCAIPLGLAGGKMGAYQIAAAVWGAVLAGPVVLLAQRRGMRAGRLAGRLLLLNPFLVHLAIYPWPKVLTGAFEVLAVYWLLRVRDGARWAGAAAGFALGMGVFTHDAAFIYVFAVLVYLVLWRRPGAAAWRSMALGALLALAIALPWAGWGVETYGWRGVLLSSPTTRANQPTTSAWVSRKVDNLVYSFVPMPLAHFLGSGPFQNQAMGWLTINAALEVPFDLYPGALGLVVSFLLLRWYGRRRIRADTIRLGWCIAVCAGLGSVLLDPAELDSGAAVNALAGAVALGLVLLAALTPEGWERRVLAAVGVETALVAALYLGYLSIGPWSRDPNVRVLAGMGQEMLSARLGPMGVAALILATLLGCLAGIGWLARASGRRLPVPALRIMAAGRDARAPKL